MQTDPRVSAGVLAKSHDSIAQSIGLFVLGMTPRMDSLKIPAARLTHVITGAAHLEQFHSSRGLNRKPPRIPRPLKGTEVQPSAGPPRTLKPYITDSPSAPSPTPGEGLALSSRSARRGKTEPRGSPHTSRAFFRGLF